MTLVGRENGKGQDRGHQSSTLVFVLCSQPLLISLQAMLLGVWVLLLLASLTPVCVYLWKRFVTKAVSNPVPCVWGSSMFR